MSCCAELGFGGCSLHPHKAAATHRAEGRNLPACPPPHPPQESGLDRLSLLRLPLADYPTGASAARALNRRLRQLGGGSLREGLAVVATSEEEQRSLAAALGVEPEVGWGAVDGTVQVAGTDACILHAKWTMARWVAPGTEPSAPSPLFLLQALQADAEHILEAGLAPPNTATAASAAAAGDAGVAAQNASLQCVFAAYGEPACREAEVEQWPLQSCCCSTQVTTTGSCPPYCSHVWRPGGLHRWAGLLPLRQAVP